VIGPTRDCTRPGPPNPPGLPAGFPIPLAPSSRSVPPLHVPRVSRTRQQADALPSNCCSTVAPRLASTRAPARGTAPRRHQDQHPDPCIAWREADAATRGSARPFAQSRWPVVYAPPTSAPSTHATRRSVRQRHSRHDGEISSVPGVRVDHTFIRCCEVRVIDIFRTFRPPGSPGPPSSRLVPVPGVAAPPRQRRCLPRCNNL